MKLTAWVLIVGAAFLCFGCVTTKQIESDAIKQIEADYRAGMVVENEQTLDKYMKLLAQMQQTEKSISERNAASDVASKIDGLEKQYEDLAKVGGGSSIVGEIRLFAFGAVNANDPMVQKLRMQGWIACEGQSLDQKDYPELYQAIGLTWGSSDTNNVFNVPDLRGQFVRGWDHGAGRDKDADSRGALAPGNNAELGGKKLSGDEVGTYQRDEFGKVGLGFEGAIFLSVPHDPGNPNATIVPEYNHDFNDSSIVQPPGGKETRPLNVYVMFCIYASPGRPVPASLFFAKS